MIFLGLFFVTFGLPYFVYAFYNPDLDTTNPKTCWVENHPTNTTICQISNSKAPNAQNMTEQYMTILLWGFYLTAIFFTLNLLILITYRSKSKVK